MFELRPHHLVCLTNFVGKGYDEKFIKNLTQISKTVKINQFQRLIKIVENVDDVCKKCYKKCDFNQMEHSRIKQLDKNWLKTLNFKIGETCSYNEIISKIKFVSIDLFKKNCYICSWKNLCLSIMFK